jgi:hypothetical protein
MNALHMSKNNGTAEPVVRDTTIFSDTGFLGTHASVLSVGDTQLLMLKAKYSAPWYMSPEDKEQLRHNKPTAK